ncbi:MAG: ExbD/TolR family protein [Verrucomicrobiota bacterium]
MRRFSQRNHLVTLNDINVTPLLDLAFVLLIIFVITTPLLEQSIQLQLPVGGEASRRPRPSDVVLVEIDARGALYLKGKPVTARELEGGLVDEHRRHPEMVVLVRGDRASAYQHVMSVLDFCRRNGIDKFDFATERGRDR